MSLSTTISFPSLPPTISRPPLHEKRSDQSEQVKLANEMRASMVGTYLTNFNFETPGDGVAHSAWGAQLDDGEVWFAVAEVVATSSPGDSAFWRREALIARSGTVAIISDTSASNASAGACAGFTVSWSVSFLYAYLQLKDAAAAPGLWRVRLTVQSVSA